MTATEFIKRIEQANSDRPNTHKIEPGMPKGNYLKWQNVNPGQELPVDLIQFLALCNGFTLFSYGKSKNGEFRLLPMKSIVYAPRLLYLDNTSCDDRFPTYTFALSDHPDGEEFIVLDTLKATYYNVDAIDGLERAPVIGSSWESVLDWICTTYKVAS